MKVLVGHCSYCGKDFVVPAEKELRPEETLRASGVNSTGMARCPHCGSHEHVSESNM